MGNCSGANFAYPINCEGRLCSRPGWNRKLARCRPTPQVEPMILGPLAAEALFICTPVEVWDGDGPIWCAEGPRVRLAGIAARELDETCRPGHPCPRARGRRAR